MPRASSPSGIPTPAPIANPSLLPFPFPFPTSVDGVAVTVTVVMAADCVLEFVAAAAADDSCCNSASRPPLNARPEPVKVNAASQQPFSGVM